MPINTSLQERCNNQCELCSANTDLNAFVVSGPKQYTENEIALCPNCLAQIEGAELNINHWRCLNDSMWSTTPAVQVAAWRMLKRLDSEAWARELMDMLYLDDETRSWAEAASDEALNKEPTLDANGVALSAGDNVVIIKDLDVKGANFVAKRGTPVRGISLTDNPAHIEGQVNGTRIVIIAQYVKKS